MLSSFYLCMTFTMLSTTHDFQLTENGKLIACDYANAIITVSEEENLDPFVLSALIYQESRFEPKVKSPVGACGLTQVVSKYVPETCKQLMNNPHRAIEVGASILRSWMIKKDLSYSKALQCYATGYKCNYPKYAKRILARSKKLKNLYLLTQRKMDNAIY